MEASVSSAIGSKPSVSGICTRTSAHGISAVPPTQQIFPSALQALLNLIDHGMALQEAVDELRDLRR